MHGTLRNLKDSRQMGKKTRQLTMDDMVVSMTIDGVNVTKEQAEHIVKLKEEIK